MSGDRLKGPSDSGSAPRHAWPAVHDHIRKGFGHLRRHLVQGYRLPGNVSVDDFHGLPGLEWHPPAEKFIEGSAQGIKITAIIEGAVHPAGLFGGDIGQGFPISWRLNVVKFSLGNRVARSKPVSLTVPDSGSTKILNGLIILCRRPCRCTSFRVLVSETATFSESSRSSRTASISFLKGSPSVFSRIRAHPFSHVTSSSALRTPSILRAWVISCSCRISPAPALSARKMPAP